MAKIITVTVPGNPVDVITLQPDMSPVSVITVSVPGQQGPGGPQGIPGAPGPSSVLSIGTVTTGPTGSAASATLSGVSPTQTLNLTIPRGDTGNTGPSPTLSIGTINTLAEGQAAVASLTGTQLAPILNLGIPRGFGVKTGGTAGQVLTKLSATENDTGWSTLTAATITDSTATGRSLVTAVDAAAARTTIDAAVSGHTHPDLQNATSSNTAGTLVRRASDGAISVGLVVSTGTPTSADHLTRKDYVDTAVATKANTVHTHASTDLTDSTTTGRALLIAVDAAAARSAIGAVSTTDSRLSDARTPTAHTHPATQISDSTATGRSLITAADAAAARATLSVPSSAYIETRYEKIIPSVEGLALTGYGHSYLDGRWNWIGPNQKYISRINLRIGTTLDNNGIAGYHMNDSVLDAVGNRSAAHHFSPGERGIGIVDCVTNDAIKYGSTTRALLNWEMSFRSLCGWLSADPDWLLDDDWAPYNVAGTWGSAAHVDYFGGGLKTLAAGSTGSLTWNHTVEGRWGFMFAGTTIGGRDMEILMDGVVVKSFNTMTAQNCGHTTTGGAVRDINVSTWFVDIPAGSHTMVIRNKAGGVATDTCFFDGMYRVNTWEPMQIFVPKAVYTNNVTDAVFNAYNMRMATVAAEYPNVHIVDTLTGYNKTIHIGGDGVHLSRLGTEFVADKMTNAIIGWFE